MVVFEFVVQKFRNPRAVAGYLMDNLRFYNAILARKNETERIAPGFPDYVTFNGREWNYSAVESVFKLFATTDNAVLMVPGESLKYANTKLVPFDTYFLRVTANSRSEAVVKVQEYLQIDLPFIACNGAFQEVKGVI